jgi:hypothetical protein
MSRLALLLVLLISPRLPAQNPLAADRFSGAYQNDEIKLELSRASGAYTGRILIAGQTLPVKAAVVNGKLAGTFESGGQSYSFEAVRNGDELALTTDGATHVLKKPAATPAAPKPAVAPPATGVVGSWQSPNGIVVIAPDGTATIGDKTHRWALNGNVIAFTGNGETLAVPFDLNGDKWTWKFPDGQLALTRIAASFAEPVITGAWQGPNGPMQLNLDGTAVVAGVPYRYTRAGKQLTLAGPDGTFVATVQLTGDTMTWVVNGKSIAFQRAASTWAIGGGNANGGILPELVGKWCQATNLNNSTGVYSRSTCFTLLADGSYQYAADFDATGQASGDAYGANSANSDVGTWTATATTITSRSRKNGVRTYQLEKRNNPKTGDPMLVLDGAEFTTAFQKTPWR